jgi:uncharacterized protein (DUF1697 family)
MTVYVALLRGINVGGKNKIKMIDLKQMLEVLGLKQVETYIQSGNVIFESQEKEKVLQEKIQEAFEQTFGFPVNVVLRTANEMEQIVQSCPFSVEEIKKAELANSEGESLYVALLPQKPLTEKIQQLNQYKTEQDDYRIVKRDMYLLFHHSIRNSKLATNLTKLNVPATVRNWKTISKLAELAKNRQAID